MAGRLLLVAGSCGMKVEAKDMAGTPLPAKFLSLDLFRTLSLNSYDVISQKWHRQARLKVYANANAILHTSRVEK
jgi:hypothetical protein